jgi:hypothetical protein
MPVDDLIFIDTNIYLDFYRVRGRDMSLSLLERIDNHRSRIISTDQVQMEYKKNRQRVILKSLKEFKCPKWSSLDVPVFLAQAQPAKMIAKSKKETRSQAGKVMDRMEKVLKSPSRTDPVYRTLQRLFRAGGPYYLSRKNKKRNEIRDLARKRYELGYPPRKDDDTSYGDAVNWEWIIRCATESGAGIIIVSRDTDYGEVHSGESILNDWLRQEFKDRVSRKRSVSLTGRLSEAFKRASIRVTEKEVTQEEEFLHQIEANKRAWQESLKTADKSTLDGLMRIAKALEGFRGFGDT